MITPKVIFGGLGRRAVETAVAGLVLAVAVGVVVASAMVVRGANTELHRVQGQQRPDVVHLVGRYNRALWELPRSGLLPPSTLPVYVPLIDPAALSGAATHATVLGRQSLLRNVVTKDGFTNTYLFGIQPSKELSVSAFRLSAGRFLHDDDQAATVLDESSARSLNVGVGDSFPVRTAAGTDLSLRVVGIVVSMALRDPPPISVPAPVADPASRFVSSGALVTLATSQQIFARDTLTDAMVIAVTPDAVPALIDRLQQAFRTIPGVFIKENYTEFRRQVADYQSTLSLFAGLAVVVAVLGVLIVAALLHDIYRGRRDQYAILLALGYPPQAVIAHAVALATVIAAGAVVGTLAALLLTPRRFAMPALLAHLGPVRPQFDTVVAALALGVTAVAIAAGTAGLGVRTDLSPGRWNVRGLAVTHDGAVVQVRGVSKTYPAGGQPVHALRDVSLHVDPGEFVALRGPSGSGKTTLLHLLAALERPNHGEIVVAGTSVPALSAAAAARFRRRHIGIVFQAYNLLPQLTALENVLLPLRAAGRSDHALATHLLERVGLAHRAQHRPTQFSGGEQQRVAIARALANNPALLLADEPTGNLDDEAAHTVLHLLITTTRDHGRTLLLVTHAPSALAAADRVLTLRAGHLEGMCGDRGHSERT